MEVGAYQEMYQEEERHWWFRGRRSVVWALLGRVKLPEKPRVLDAGCGTGRNLLEFGALGLAAGVDPSAEAVEFCQQRGLDNVRRAGLEALPFDDDEFDLLLACDVIEHVDDDIGALRELHRVASARAFLVITVPAYQWLWTEHDVQLHHVRRYTLSRVRSRAEGAGWSPVHATYFNSILLPAVAAARGMSRVSARRGGSRRRGHTDLDRTPGGLNGLLELPLRLEAGAISRGVRLPAGVSVGMICAKRG